MPVLASSGDPVGGAPRSRIAVPSSSGDPVGGAAQWQMSVRCSSCEPAVESVSGLCRGGRRRTCLRATRSLLARPVPSPGPAGSSRWPWIPRRVLRPAAMRRGGPSPTSVRGERTPVRSPPSIRARMRFRLRRRVAFDPRESNRRVGGLRRNPSALPFHRARGGAPVADPGVRRMSACDVTVAPPQPPCMLRARFEAVPLHVSGRPFAPRTRRIGTGSKRPATCLHATSN